MARSSFFLACVVLAHLQTGRCLCDDLRCGFFGPAANGVPVVCAAAPAIGIPLAVVGIPAVAPAPSVGAPALDAPALTTPVRFTVPFGGTRTVART